MKFKKFFLLLFLILNVSFNWLYAGDEEVWKFVDLTDPTMLTSIWSISNDTATGCYTLGYSLDSVFYENGNEYKTTFGFGKFNFCANTSSFEMGLSSDGNFNTPEATATCELKDAYSFYCYSNKTNFSWMSGLYVFQNTIPQSISSKIMGVYDPVKNRLTIDMLKKEGDSSYYSMTLNLVGSSFSVSSDTKSKYYPVENEITGMPILSNNKLSLAVYVIQYGKFYNLELKYNSSTNSYSVSNITEVTQ